MWGPFTIDDSSSDNGGWWSDGAEYSEGWFYIPSGSKRSARSGGMVEDINSLPELHGNTTLMDGRTINPSRLISLNFLGNNQTEVAQDFSLNSEGKYISNI
jgi:hypothetical protein